MGIFCPDKRDKIIIECFYEFGNKQQKTFCIKLIEEIDYNRKPIKFSIQANNSFLIKVRYNGEHIIANAFSQKTLEEIKSQIDYIIEPSHFSFTHTESKTGIFEKNNSLVKQVEEKSVEKSGEESEEETEEETEEEIKRLNNLKSELLERRKFIRFTNDINQELEDMCIYGNIMKKIILKEKKNHPEKYININDALKLEKKDKEMFALGLLAYNLQNNGVKVIIEKNKLINEEEIDEGSLCLQFITNGLWEKTKYNLYFDFGRMVKEDSLEELKEKLKEKLSKDFNIDSDKIIVIITFPKKGLVEIIFQSYIFNNLDLNAFRAKLENDNKYILPKLKKIETTNIIMGGCKLTRNQLDSKGNKFRDWPLNEKRGNRSYIPPIGWIGIGLNVLDKYGRNNNWLGMNNSEEEWCVAYQIIGKWTIMNKTSKIFRDRKTVTSSTGNFFGDKVGCTPNIKIAEAFTREIKINNISYKAVLMVRVNPKAIKEYKQGSLYFWIVNGIASEIRPYRILYKEVEIKR